MRPPLTRLHEPDGGGGDGGGHWAFFVSQVATLEQISFPAFGCSCLCNRPPEDRGPSPARPDRQGPGSDLSASGNNSLQFLQLLRGTASLAPAHARLLLPRPFSYDPSSPALGTPARRQAIGGARSQWASLLLGGPASGVGAALEAWQRSAASGVGTMSSIGTGVSLFRAVLSGSALPGVRGAGPLDPGRCRSPGDPRPGPSAP